MKKISLTIVMVVMSLFMISCSETTIRDLLDNELNGPNEYYEMMDGYWVTIGGSLNSPALDLYAELISVAGMLDEFYGNAEWDGENSRWVYQYSNETVVTTVYIMAGSESGEFDVEWTVFDGETLLWEGSGSYHTGSKSLKTLFTTSGRKIWLQTVKSTDDTGYFTYIAYEDLTVPFAPEVYAPSFFIAKIWAKTDLTEIKGRVIDSYPADSPFETFTAAAVEIYDNPPTDWDSWNTMPSANWYYFNYVSGVGLSQGWASPAL
ncbi:MAG TPA: hypothetical protein ENN72_04110 [Firmicutes bacterium]|nr:hypothetical protein [Bacillota bacterium]